MLTRPPRSRRPWTTRNRETRTALLGISTDRNSRFMISFPFPNPSRVTEQLVKYFETTPLLTPNVVMTNAPYMQKSNGR